MVTANPSTHKLTYAEFLELDIPEGDTSIYELINGEIVKRASPNAAHQSTSFKLSGIFFIYNQETKAGHFFTAPYDVYFEETSAGIQPDILFVSKERDFIIQQNNGVVGAPDLIVEIVSKGSVDKDRVIKKELYERFAVREFWIVDPAYKTVEVYQMADHRYHLAGFAEGTGKINSSVLPGFELEVSDIFE
ncbi:MAG: Uma2 family endonuclease [Thermoanaerobaculia bacterium]|nr:Uma2 family endonuclease [Thermoanaerobaculia bacterium]